MQDEHFVISGFAEEIASDLETQLDTLERLGIDHLDLRGVDGTNVLDFTDEEVDSGEEEASKAAIRYISPGLSAP